MDKPAAWTATINELLEEWVCRQPNRRLFAFLDGRGDIIEDFSYAEFSRRVDTLTSELIKMDWLKVGDRIILSYQPGIEIIAAFFACSKAGLVAIPAPPLDRFDILNAKSGDPRIPLDGWQRITSARRQ